MIIDEKIKKKLMSYLSSKVFSHEDREDILQETILSFLLQKTLIHQSYEGYLFGICKNKVKEYYRLKKSQKRLIDLNLENDINEEFLLNKELFDNLTNRELIILKERFFNKKTLKEIALTHHINYATLRWQMSKIISKLRINFEKEIQNGKNELF